MSERPTLLMLVGAPGAGKSSWIRRHPDAVTRRHYDLDAMAQALGDYNDPACRARAKEVRDVAIADHLRNRETFSFETTFGVSKLRVLDEAKKRGFRVEAVYVSIENPKTNLDRIDYRVAHDIGHWVEPEQVARRRRDAHNNLVDTAHQFDAIELIDNTEGYFRLVAHLEGRKVIEVTDDLPGWAEGLLRDIQSRDRGLGR